METNVIKQNRISTLTSTHHNLIKHRPQHPSSIVSVLRKPSNHDIITEETSKNTTRTINVYKDNWFDLIAINHLSKTVQAATGSYIPFCSFYCNLIVISMRSYRVCSFYSLQDSETIRVAMRALLRQLLWQNRNLVLFNNKRLPFKLLIDSFHSLYLHW